MKFNKKGQLSIINVAFFMILVIFVAIITPIINDIIQTSISANNITGTSALVMNSIIPVLWLIVIITLVLYVMPVRPNQY
jgi:purine-cytosine permease-like protein